MKALLETVFGSHLFGTALPTSDVDRKVVYLPELNDLLLAKKPKNKVHQTNTDGRNTAEDVDTEYVPVHEFVRHFVSGQSYALELAWCPALEDEATNPHFRELVMALRNECLTRDMSGLVGYCLGQARKYSAKGDRLNAVRAVQQMLDGYDRKMRLEEAVPNLTHLTLNNKYVAFTEDETHKHLKVCDKLLPFTLRVEEALERLEHMESTFGERAKRAAEFDGADWKAMMHAVRLAYEAKELLTTLRLTLPLPDEQCEYLLRVRKGEVLFDEVMSDLTVLVDEVTTISNNSTVLPTRNEVQERAEELLLEFLYESYEEFE